MKYILENNKDDLKFLELRLLDEEKGKPQKDRSDMSLTEKLHFVVDNNFKRVSYTEAIEILKNCKPNICIYISSMVINMAVKNA